MLDMPNYEDDEKTTATTSEVLGYMGYTVHITNLQAGKKTAGIKCETMEQGWLINLQPSARALFRSIPRQLIILFNNVSSDELRVGMPLVFSNDLEENALQRCLADGVVGKISMIREGLEKLRKREPSSGRGN